MSKACFTILADCAALRITGADAQNFLQAQLSSDVAALAPGDTQLSSFCSPQGRVLAVLQIMATPDGFLAVLPRDLAEATVKRLRMFVLRAEVGVESASDMEVVAAWGEAIDEVLVRAGLPAPPSAGHCANADGLYLLSQPGKTPSVLMIGSRTRSADSLAAAGMEQVESDHWLRARIEAGIPAIHVETADQFLPQMLGLDELGAVSFRKGCYPGQEVIARARYRGQVKRHLVRGTAPARLAAGDTLSADGTAAATVLMSARKDESRWLFLAVARDALVQHKALMDAEGRVVNLD